MIWQRIGCRHGPGTNTPIPKKVPAPGQWDDDRGQFISAENEIVWRRGKWEKRFDKVEKQDTISFFFSGPGYRDYECTQVAHPEEEFKGHE